MLSLGDGGFASAAYPVPASPTVTAVPGRSGLPDLAVASNGLDETVAGVQLLTNLGDGSFSVGTIVSVPRVIFMTSGDFNGDCIPDVVAGIFQNCGDVSWSITVLYGDGLGGFGATQALQSASNAPAGMAPLGPVESHGRLQSPTIAAPS